MSMVAGKEELALAGQLYKEMATIQKAIDKIALKNNTSRCIVSMENVISQEAIFETGKIDGRVEALQIILKEFGYNLNQFNY